MSEIRLARSGRSTASVIRLEVASTPQPHPGYDATKRLLDVVGALILIVAATPLVIVSAAIILLTSGRPLFFAQRRLGHRGQEFTCWKLRTMVPDAEQRRDEVLHLNTTGGPAFKHPDDPRLTGIGRHLRAFSIDELPQLWNVLRGDLSLVGPRALPVLENQYTGRQADRLSVKPGLTCIWQVSGRSEVTFERWMEMDLEYVDSRSIWKDLVLLLRTPMAVLSRRGAM